MKFNEDMAEREGLRYGLKKSLSPVKRRGRLLE